MQRRGIVTLVFDDGYRQVFDHVVPFLDSSEVHGVFAVTLDHAPLATREQRDITPWTEWLRVRERGHELAAHGATHTDLTTLSSDALEHELGEPQSKLDATTLVYPGGAYNERVVQAARRHFRAARTVQRGFERLPTSEPMALRSFNYTRRNFSLAKANARVLWAAATGRWLIETYHYLDDEETRLEHNVPLTAFMRHVQFIKRRGVPIRTIQEVL